MMLNLYKALSSKPFWFSTQGFICNFKLLISYRSRADLVIPCEMPLNSGSLFKYRAMAADGQVR